MTASTLEIGQDAELALCKPRTYHLNTISNATITFFTFMSAVAMNVCRWSFRSAVGSRKKAQAIVRMPVSTTTGITFSNTAERCALLVGSSTASHSSRQRTRRRYRRSMRAGELLAGLADSTTASTSHTVMKACIFRDPVTIVADDSAIVSSAAVLVWVLRLASVSYIDAIVPEAAPTALGTDPR